MMGPQWYERAEDALVEAVNSGEMSEAEFRLELRSLNDELRYQALDAAEDAYEREMNGW